MASRSLGTLTLDLVAKVGGFTGPIDKAARDLDRQTQGMRKSLDGFSASLKTIGAGIAGFLSGAAVAGFAGLAVGIKKTVDSMDELSKSAQKVGVTTEELSRLAYAGDLADVSLETITSTLGKLTKAQAAALDESSKTAKVFDALGVSVKNADGSLRSSTAVLGDFAERFKDLGGSPEAIAAGFQIFGRSFQELIPLLKDGREGIQSAGDELERFGGVISTEAGQAAEEFNDNLTRLKTQFGAIFAQVAQQLLPTLVKLSDDLKDLAGNGDLARNAVSLLSSAIDLGVGIFKAYNAAVDNVSVAIEQAIKSYAGWTEITKNVATFGFADGSVVDGINKIRDATNEAAAARANFAALRNTRQVQAETQGIDFTQGAPLSAAEQAAGNRKLSVALADVTEKKKRATKATKEQIEAEKLFKAEILEVNDLIDEISRDTQSDLFFDRQSRSEDQKAFLSDLAFEGELLGKTAEQQEVLNNLRYAGADANSDYGRSIISTTEAIQAQREATEQQIAVMDTFRLGLEDSFADVVSGAKSFKDAFVDMVDSIIASLTNLIAQNLIEQAFGQMGSTGAGSSGGWISAFASLFAGGRETGGPVAANRLYRVNESGAEMLSVGGRDYLMMGGQSGRVTPAGQFGGGLTIQNTYINPRLNDMRSESQRRQREAAELRLAAGRNGR
jgi:hypothetical protein